MGVWRRGARPAAKSGSMPCVLIVSIVPLVPFVGDFSGNSGGCKDSSVDGSVNPSLLLFMTLALTSLMRRCAAAPRSNRSIALEM